MQITRREFLALLAYSAAVVGCSGGGSSGGTAPSATSPTIPPIPPPGAGGPTVLWLSGAACSGCTVSLANRIAPSAPTDVGDLLINHINLAYHATLMGAAGDLAVKNLKDLSAGPFILAVEGGIPTAFNGKACVLWSDGGTEVTALSAVRDLASRSIANLCIGTCASFGGVAAGSPNPTQIQSLSQATGKSTINIPGCPAHPDWIVLTIAELLAGRTPALDSSGRPTTFFSGDSLRVHSRCPRREAGEASTFGLDGRCLEELGCKGPSTQGDCPTRLWNNKTNWCVGANAICLGCTESGFPDRFSPFYRQGGG
ncbi:MAG: hydrogenase small subunit [Syntrophaceae bacterium]